MKNEIKLKQILDYVNKKTGVDSSLSNRNREVIYARALYYKIALRAVKASYKNIGSLVKKNHATVIHAKNKVFYEIEKDDFYMDPYREYFGEKKHKDVAKVVEKKILTDNEKAYRKLSDEDKITYDERASLVLKSFEWKRKDDNRKEVFEIINVGM